jgi:hypothetical protein
MSGAAIAGVCISVIAVVAAAVAGLALVRKKKEMATGEETGPHSEPIFEDLDPSYRTARREWIG